MLASQGHGKTEIHRGLKKTKTWVGLAYPKHSVIQQKATILGCDTWTIQGVPNGWERVPLSNPLGFKHHPLEGAGMRLSVVFFTMITAGNFHVILGGLFFKAKTRTASHPAMLDL